MGFSVLIPAYNPDGMLIELIASLTHENVDQIIVVDDGSRAECQTIFDTLQRYPKVFLVKHAINLGKGRALKTGFNYYLLTASADSNGIVTADADGQHLPSDIIKVGNALSQTKSGLIIGSREFSGNVPFRSKLGNLLTRYIFRLIVGKKITDTQSGLRGIPMGTVYQILPLDGERYEYELAMLVNCKVHNTTVVEIPISTVYIENNKSSHFNPLLDSMKIYFVLLRFISSSVITVVIDFVIFYFTLTMFGNLLWSFVWGRVFALIFNFSTNKALVFKSHGNTMNELIKYMSLVFVMGASAYFITTSIMQLYGVSALLVKAAVESILFTVNFIIQREFVFINMPEIEPRRTP